MQHFIVFFPSTLTVFMESFYIRVYCEILFLFFFKRRVHRSFMLKMQLLKGRTSQRSRYLRRTEFRVVIKTQINSRSIFLSFFSYFRTPLPSGCIKNKLWLPFDFLQLISFINLPLVLFFRIIYFMSLSAKTFGIIRIN